MSCHTTAFCLSNWIWRWKVWIILLTKNGCFWLSRRLPAIKRRWRRSSSVCRIWYLTCRCGCSGRFRMRRTRRRILWWRSSLICPHSGERARFLPGCSALRLITWKITGSICLRSFRSALSFTGMISGTGRSMMCRIWHRMWKNLFWQRSWRCPARTLCCSVWMWRADVFLS